jgi:hypothetical protein
VFVDSFLPVSAQTSGCCFAKSCFARLLSCFASLVRLPLASCSAFSANRGSCLSVLNAVNCLCFAGRGQALRCGSDPLVFRGKHSPCVVPCLCLHYLVPFAPRLSKPFIVLSASLLLFLAPAIAACTVDFSLTEPVLFLADLAARAAVRARNALL